MDKVVYLGFFDELIPAMDEQEEYLSQADYYIAQGNAENTLKSYKGAWDHFCLYARDHGVKTLPVDVKIILDYLAGLPEENHYKGGTFKTSTIEHRRWAIRKVHHRLGLPDPTSHSSVEMLMKGLRMKHGMSPDQAIPIEKVNLNKIVRRLDDQSNVCLRDRTLLLVGFIGAFRKSELLGVRIQDITFSTSHASIKVSKSKSDQESKGNYKAIPYNETHPDICPVLHIKALISAVGENKGHLFQGMTPRGDRFNGRPLSSSRFHEIFKNHVGKEFTTHSLRSGFVTLAKEQGVSNEKIMQQTWHKTEKSIRNYDRRGDNKRENAANDLKNL